MSQGLVVAARKKIYLGNQQTKGDGSREYPWELCCDGRLKGKGEERGQDLWALYNGPEMGHCLSYSYLDVFNRARTTKMK